MGDVSSKITLKETQEFGKGIFASQNIKKDEHIFNFEGPKYHYGDELHYEHWTQDLHDHAVQIAEHIWVSNTGIGQYINHSCEPNCGIKNLTQVVAMRDIKIGEQLTYDYEMTENSVWKMQCKCGTPRCRGTIGAFNNMPSEIRQKYRGYISEWLLGK
jgi:hypothetical protein